MGKFHTIRTADYAGIDIKRTFLSGGMIGDFTLCCVIQCGTDFSVTGSRTRLGWRNNAQVDAKMNNHGAEVVAIFLTIVLQQARHARTQLKLEKGGRPSFCFGGVGLFVPLPGPRNKVDPCNVWKRWWRASSYNSNRHDDEERKMNTVAGRYYLTPRKSFI
jgi:hypothetical protein